MLDDAGAPESMPLTAAAVGAPQKTEFRVARESVDPFKQASAPLGVRFLYAGDNQDALNPFKVLDFDPKQAGNGFGFLNEASNAARLGPGNNDNLAAERANFVKGGPNGESNIAFDKIMGISRRKGEVVPEAKIEEGVDFLASCFDVSVGENQPMAKIEVLFDKLSQYYSNHQGELDSDSQAIHSLFKMFGEAPGVAAWQAFMAKMKMGDPAFIQDAKDNMARLSESEAAFLQTIQSLVHKWNDFQAGKKIPESISGAEVKKEQSGTVEDQQFPANAGGSVIGLRGKEKSGDSRGQDRLFYKKLANGAEVYSVTDGAGEVGHEVAEKVSQRLAELLDGTDIASVSADKLKEMAQQIHSEMQNFSGQKSGATLDAVVKLPNGKKFAMHVGEGTIFKLRTKEELGQKLLQGSLFEALTQPHGFGVDSKGEPIRTPNGIKTREMGVDVQITPDVMELQEGTTYLLTSDGFSDVLAGAPISSVEFTKRFNESPQKAAEYLVGAVSQYSQNKYGKDADDVAVMIIK